MDLTLSDGINEVGGAFGDSLAPIGQTIFAHCYGWHSRQYALIYHQVDNQYKWAYCDGYEWGTGGTWSGLGLATGKVQVLYYQQSAYYLPYFLYCYEDTSFHCIGHGISGAVNPFKAAGSTGDRYIYHFDGCKNDVAANIPVVGVVRSEGSTDINVLIVAAYFNTTAVHLRTPITVVDPAPAGESTIVKILEIPGSNRVVVGYGGYVKIYSVARDTAPVLIASIATGVNNDTSVFGMVADWNVGQLLIYNTTTACSCSITPSVLGTPNTFSIADADYDYLRTSIWSLYVSGEYGIAGSTTTAPEGPVFMKLTLTGQPYFARPEGWPPFNTDYKHPAIFAYDPSEHGLNGDYTVLSSYGDYYLSVKYAAFSGTFPLPEGGSIDGVGHAVFPDMVSSGYGEVIGIMGVGIARFPEMQSVGYAEVDIVGVGRAVFPPMKTRGTFPNTGRAVFQVMESSGYAYVGSIGTGRARFPVMESSGFASIDILGEGRARFPEMKSRGYVDMWTVGAGRAVFPIMISSGYATVDTPAGIGTALFPAMRSRGYAVVTGADDPDDVLDFEREFPTGAFAAIPDNEEVVDYE